MPVIHTIICKLPVCFFGRREARGCLEAVWGIFLSVLQTYWLRSHAAYSWRKFIWIHWKSGCTSQLPHPLLQGYQSIVFPRSILWRQLGFTVWFLQEMNAPSFRVEKNPDGALLLHYYSDRRGLCHIVPGDWKTSTITNASFIHEFLCSLHNSANIWFLINETDLQQPRCPLQV